MGLKDDGGGAGGVGGHIEAEIDLGAVLLAQAVGLKAGGSGHRPSSRQNLVLLCLNTN